MAEKAPALGVRMTKKTKMIILHGWSYSLDKWRDFIDAMEKHGYECELLAVPGLTQAIDKVWTLDDYIAWLDKLLDSREKPILLGHSNGGRLALAYTHRFPHKVQSLILIASAGVIHKDLKTRAKKTFFKWLAKAGKLLAPSEKLKKILYTFARERDYYQASPIMKQTMINLISVDMVPLLVDINIPTLLVWGEKDRVTPLSDGQTMQAALPKAKLVTLPAAKHAPQFSHPQETAAIIVNNQAKI